MEGIIKVTAAILVKNHKVLIAQRKNNDHLSGMWEFPGGKIETGETPEECLISELKEELDIDIIVRNCLGSNTHHYELVSIELIVFRTS